MPTHASTFDTIDPHSAMSMMELVSAYGDARVDLDRARGADRRPAADHAQRLYQSLTGYLIEICPTVGDLGGR